MPVQKIYRERKRMGVCPACGSRRESQKRRLCKKCHDAKIKHDRRFREGIRNQLSKHEKTLEILSRIMRQNGFKILKDI